MKKRLKELIKRCVSYTLYMGELWFDKDELKLLKEFQNDKR